ncbi:ketopantoate reductase ApbA/PanE [Amycolatopsis mediterranei S699]|uniref:Ketopantoate reductase ApbA/PanE n=2 Tax=Amycolatopsis mediterranei TaxID=33910 RepID=A0A0H3DBX1_AMYMU|nr:2-dehydropantoate 2-reductase N-terminal domain-containing protein [Amycolatopsis mediterranei]ADJ48171.1 ketopantoate reductase ApbA/PanE [Amycolatopsis mediterranei U32]AEK45075.1 ketopantoate reductase ApbA/PanE [Amycolatopsis mediterranei S699]AFO79882.1 ketopantoate reductase ApbA/PanE [Amycolatopsis mediterranei S699]AGT87010.1 ketopantoate reductase ApbA/PanE [Amycolatopsis mediterranei RB]KDO10656.1 ketopantoate reductase [Amycolatopsis mediterranei]
MKILMFGRGVIGTVYGWALERAGHEIEFYVRPGRAATYGDTVDLDLLDTRRRMRGERVVEQWPVRYREALEPDHDFDLIVLSVSHHRLAEAAAFLAPRVSGATVLVFGNIWAEPTAAIGALPLDRIAWGFPQAGGGFGADGVLRGVLLPSVVFGTLGRPPTDRERAVRRVFREAGLRLKERPDFRGWLRVHFVSDAGLHSQGLRRGSLSELAGSTGDLREALLAGRELLPLLEARGVDLRRHRGGVLLFRAPAWLTAPVFAWLTAHVALARMTLQAHSDPEAQEPREVCRDTLAEARRLGISVPRLEAAEPYFAREGKKS